MRKRKIKVVHILSNTTDAESYIWIADGINKDHFSISFILLNSGPSFLEDGLKQKGHSVRRILFRGKRDIFRAFITVLFSFIRSRPDVVHCHLMEASIVGLMAGKLLGIRKRFYTRHFSSYNHLYYPHVVKFDLLCNKLATNIIATNENVSATLQNLEKVPKQRIQVVNLGFRLDRFKNVDKEQIIALKRKYNPEGKGPVVGVIARYDECKGLEYIAQAFQQLLRVYPNAYLIHANAKGGYQPAIDAFAKLPKDTYRSIPFEPNVYALYHLFDVFVHVPVNSTIEAFGQVYVEAMAAGVPCVCTISGIANEFVKDRVNALVVNYCDASEILKATQTILNEKSLSIRLVERASSDVLGRFDITSMIKKLEYIYVHG